MTTNLSIPFYLNNNPVIRLSDTLSNGVIVHENNVLTGEKISYDSKYLKIQDSAKPANSFVYIDKSNSFGSFAFPEKQEGEESFILTSTTNEAEGPGYIWTNILNLPLTKYLTTDFTINSTSTKFYIDNGENDNSILFWDSDNYNYVGIFDLYITLDTIEVSNLLKTGTGTGICLVLNNEENNEEDSLQKDIDEILDITNTVYNHFHKVKVINNIITPKKDSSKITLNYYYYLIDNYNNDPFFDENNKITVTKPKNDNLKLNIKGTLTIFEFKK